MAVYAITGGLGAGKSLQAVAKIRDALQKGLRVATNMDVHIEHLVAGKQPRYDVTRLPDYPLREHFEALGPGSRGKFDEKKFGWIVLDEVATFLNNREWNSDPNDTEKEGAQKRAVQKRLAMINWLRHARKHCWHLILVTQGLSSLDAQIRNELIEHEVTCRRMDRLSVPVLSWLTKALGFGALKLPQVHVGVVYYRELGRPTKVDTWYVPDAKQLHPAYKTEQVLDGVCQGYTLLDHRHAPYLWKPRGVGELLWQRWGWRWFPPSDVRRRHDDFRLSQLGAAPAYKQHTSYKTWLDARAAHDGPIGAEGGESAEPVRAEPERQAA